MDYTCRNCIYRMTEDCINDETRRKCGGFKLDCTTLPLYEQITLDEWMNRMKGV